MRASVGRRLFFDRVAEGLLIAFGTTPPRLLVIKADLVSVPLGDVAALAHSICDLQGQTDQQIVTIEPVHITTPLRSDRSYVIDGRGGGLSAVMELIDGRCEDGFPVVIYNCVDDGPDTAAVAYEPSTSADVLVPAIHELFEQCGKILDSLAFVRFQLRGFAVFENEYEVFETPRLLGWSEEVTERFCTRLASGWRFSDCTMAPGQILEWLRQFDLAGFGDEGRQLLVYLHRYGYVTEQKMTSRMLDAYRRLASNMSSEPIAVAFQEPGKSESKLAYRLRPEISLVAPETAIERAAKWTGTGPITFVCFDDCIGSGETIEKYLFTTKHNRLADKFGVLYAAGVAKMHVVVYHSDARGVERVVNHPAGHGSVIVDTLAPLDSTHRVFSDDSRIILDPVRRAAFREFCREKGEQLFPGNPLGWGDCQWCVAYDYSIPDTSLPVLFASAETPFRWVALFPRNR